MIRSGRRVWPYLRLMREWKEREAMPDNKKGVEGEGSHT
jgi:hypothetical protein